jgi:hypothetical protein
MARIVQKILVVLGIGSMTLFQAGGCDTGAAEFLKGIQDGYTSVTGTSLATDLGKELAGLNSGSDTSGSSGSAYSNYSPYPNYGGYYYWGQW